MFRQAAKGSKMIGSPNFELVGITIIAFCLMAIVYSLKDDKAVF